ncbi:MAG: hypothetical protein ABEK03_08720 [Candidatus Bipolaricaulia bacterium]
MTTLAMQMPQEERLFDEYQRDKVALRLTQHRLIVEGPSPKLLGGRTSQTTMFIGDIDAIERDVEGHDGLAVLAIGVFSLSWLSQDGRLPLLVIALALIVAFMMTRRASVVFHAGTARAAIEYSGEEDPELERFLDSVEQMRARHL